MTAQMHRLYHLGTARLTRTTLSRINEDKPYSLYESLFERLLSRCQTKSPKHQFRFKNTLYLMDATTIDLCLSVFPWAKFRSTKGAVKLHVGLNHNGYLPEFVTITDGKGNDSTQAKAIQFPRNSIVVVDKGYNDYSWYNQLNEQSVFFVTRLKSNACYKIIERRKVIKSKGITSDQIISFTGAITAKKCPVNLRRVGYRDELTGKHYVFLTNNMSLAANTIANLYKSRWQVELFFKWIKQNLKIKTFIGTSKNAVMTQIWVAMCVYLIIAFLKFQSKIHQSMQQILRMLQLNLFEKRDLMALLKGVPIKLNVGNDNQAKLF